MGFNASIEQFYMALRKRMIYYNKNIIMVICGETGGGKSWGSIEIADRICPRGITIDRSLIMADNIKFMKKLVNKDNLQAGDILIYDEGGAGFSARDFQAKTNKLIGSVLQTFRGMNVGVIFTVPNLSFIDIQARKLCHFYLEAQYIDYDNEEVVFRVYEIQHNSRYDKTYFKCPIVPMNGKPKKISHIRVRKPRKKLVNDYEELKADFIEQHNLKVLENLQNRGKPKKVVRWNNIEEDFNNAKKLIASGDKFKKMHNNKPLYDRSAVSTHFNVGRGRADRIVNNALALLKEQGKSV